MARLITREAAAARRSAVRTRWLTHKPLSASVDAIPAVNTRPRAPAKSPPARCEPVTENSTAWLRVSNERANAAPTAAMSTGCSARVRRANARLRSPTGRTISPRGVRASAARLAAPSIARNAIEIHTPVCSSHAGAFHSVATVATATATAVTTTPWPREKSSPDQRASFGRRCALKRVRPSIAARWSGSSPCLSPRRKTTATRDSQCAGRESIIFSGRIHSTSFPISRLPRAPSRARSA